MTRSLSEGATVRKLLPVVALLLVAVAGAANADAPSGPGGAKPKPTHRITTVNGLRADVYRWIDSKGRPRAVFLKREGEGNPGHGGYAIRMTYQARFNGKWRTIVADATSGGDGGFGYFVSHERYRDFSDGSNNTIAARIFGADDSPLGLGFKVTGRSIALRNPSALAHRFRLTYPRYGTTSPIPKNADGEDVSATPITPESFKLYSLPVTLTWMFETGRDYPRIKVNVSLANVPGPDLVNFDIRAPYGVLDFDNGGNSPISTVMWGDRYHFKNTNSPLTRNSGWTWNQPNNGARYNALIAGGFEMGLFEPKKFSKSKLGDGFAFGRGSTSAAYRCDDQDEALPCDWEWPYQSAQYSLPYDNNNAPTTFEKIAWGTAPYWGTGSSMTRVWDSSTTTEAFQGFPPNKIISYDICIVLGKTIAGGLTKSVAGKTNYNCARAVTR